jgi:hypothetical protein
VVPGFRCSKAIVQRNSDGTGVLEYRIRKGVHGYMSSTSVHV